MEMFADQLHIALASTYLNRQMTVIENRYGKIQAVRDNLGLENRYTLKSNSVDKIL
jgi:hypothetical protein